ncbi:TPA: hypothetical protein SMO11_000124 [Pseudomonas aeruginosa]|nr:hypothetical protein [Pseudomonas aeruginosa]HEJ9985968.1 hypothetical protein [Pseudomonas aeruginosa]
MSEVKRYINCVIGMTGVEMVRATDYAKLSAEAQALREEIAKLRITRDDFKLERDLARKNFCDEQAANYQLQAHLKACLDELSALRARVVVVPERLTNGDSISRMLREIGCDGDVSYHHAREIWNACLDELARLNGMTVSASALDTLRRFATGEVGHLNNGHCPDDLEGRETRDPDCLVCKALIDTEKSK